MGRLFTGALSVVLLAVSLVQVARVAGVVGLALVTLAIVALALAVWATPSPFGPAVEIQKSPGHRFVDHLAREFERSRRYGRTFCMARLAFATPGSSRSFAGRVGPELRQSDVLGVSHDTVYLLLAETDRSSARLALKRLGYDPVEAFVLAEYPSDGVTVGALLESLHEDRIELGDGEDRVLDAYRRLPEVGVFGNDPAVLRAEVRQLRSKRLIDLVVLALVTPVVLPLGLLVAAAIRLDSPGKALFVQERTGFNGHRFKMYKFRSMVQNASDLKASLQHLNVLQPPDFKIVNDPRITRVGRFIRASSLDELPQLLNVLRGDMTLVGPRPTSFASETYANWHTQRLEAPPGVTGLWQVSARHESGFDERLRLDVGYISHMSVWTDARIVGRTVTSVVRAKGA